MPEIIDDKSEHCIPFILHHIKQHRETHQSQGNPPPPFFVGLNGVQGAGKTTLVETLSSTLASPPHNLPTLVLSIDDLYLPHPHQQALAATHPTNPLIQHRGQPSTHDIPLALHLFTALAHRAPNIRIPSYDKSAFAGQGDRRPESAWRTVNAPGAPPIDVVLFEGWCVGFRAQPDAAIAAKWEAARAAFERDGPGYAGQLGKLDLSSVLFVNEALRAYEALTERFGAFVHIDAEDPLDVYTWRQEQEAALRATRGSGMTEAQVVEFVNGYYPAYELYTDALRRGILPGRQLRLVVGRDRRVKGVEVV